MLDRNIEIFIKVAEFNSFTVAAQVLYISQPAVSHAIKHLEDELKVQLFYRDKRKGLVITDIGKKILSLVRQMEDIDNRITQIAYQENNLISGTLRIASLPSLTASYVSHALKMFHQLYPNVKIEIREGTPQEVKAMVDGYMVDLAFSTSPYDQYDYITIKEDQMLCISQSSSKRKVILSKLDHTLILTKSAFETVMDNTKNGNFIDMKNVIIVQNLDSMMNMVNDGIGDGIISAHPLTYIKKEYTINDLKPDINFEIGVFTNNLNELTPVAKEFVRILKENIV